MKKIIFILILLFCTSNLLYVSADAPKRYDLSTTNITVNAITNSEYIYDNDMTTRASMQTGSNAGYIIFGFNEPIDVTAYEMISMSPIVAEFYDLNDTLLASYGPTYVEAGQVILPDQDPNVTLIDIKGVSKIKLINTYSLSSARRISHFGIYTETLSPTPTPTPTPTVTPVPTSTPMPTTTPIPTLTPTPLPTVTPVPTFEPVPPDAPIIASYALMSDRIRINWQSKSNVTGYNVYLDGVLVNDEPIVSNTYSIVGLDKHVTYQVYIRAINDYGMSDTSNIISFVLTDKMLPNIEYTYSLKDISDGVTNMFGSMWTLLAFIIAIPLSFIIGNRVKRLF